MLEKQLIGGVMIDWAKISQYSYLRTIPALSNVDEIRFTHNVTFFVGENGSGKSTLLEAMAIASGFNPEGGSRNYNFSTYDSHSELCGAKEDEYSRGPGGRPQHFHEKSHGESFLALAQNSFRPGGLYFLDEPEAALSPQRQLTLLVEIDRCACGGAQFFIVTHSPILLGLPGAEILSFDGGPVHPIEYEETDSYQVTEMFINNREQILRRLLEN